MRYIESPSHDAWFNMALEEYVFEALPKNESWFMLWQNENAIVVGKYQNTVEEIDPAYVREQNITVVRRLSGGGAMYQDLGNLNFTFVVAQNQAKTLDFTAFTAPVVRALQKMGVDAQASSRNDITIDGQKISGNSQYNKQGRTMHHGTLLFSSNLDVIGNALRVKPDKIASKGVKSVRSRVTNVAEHLEAPVTLAQFKAALLEQMFGADGLNQYHLTPADLAAVQALRDEKYATWAWNYGNSPAYSLRRHRRYPFGGVTVSLATAQSVLQAVHFSGDFFGNGDIAQLEQALAGVPLEETRLLAALEALDVGAFIHGMDAPTLAALILYG